MYQLAGASAYRFPGGDPPYVLDVAAVATGVVTASSDGTLAVFDVFNLAAGPKRTVATSHGSALKVVREMDAYGCLLATAGSDGTVALWDLRDPAPGRPVTVPVGACAAGVASLACDAATQSIAAGTELADGQASIVVWDIRAGPTPRVQYNEVHSDDVTELCYHPRQRHILLSGSTDGLVNICDTSIADEDDVVVTAFNHGASIHRAGFLNDSEVYALSHDEKLALFDAAAEREAGSATRDFGDLRPLLGCQYVANVLPRAGAAPGAILGVGSQDAASFQLVHLAKNDDGAAWDLARDSAVDLPGAHGSDIVRSFFVLDANQTVFTCGEDGSVRAWSPPA